MRTDEKYKYFWITLKGKIKKITFLRSVWERQKEMGYEKLILQEFYDGYAVRKGNRFIFLNNEQVKAIEKIRKWKGVK